MVFGDSSDDIFLNRSRSVSCVFSSFSSPVPQKVGSLLKILSWFSFKGRSRNEDDRSKRRKKRALHDLIAKFIKRRKKGRVVLNSSNAKVLCVPSLFLYERISQSESSNGANKSFLSRRTASDANVSYKCTYEKTIQNSVIPLKDKIGCYFSVIVDGKQYNLSDFFVNATSETNDLITENETPERIVRTDFDMFKVNRKLLSKNDKQSKGDSKHYAKTEDIDEAARVRHGLGVGDCMKIDGKRDLQSLKCTDDSVLSRSNHPVFHNASGRTKHRFMKAGRDDSWNTVEEEVCSVQENDVSQDAFVISGCREGSSSSVEKRSCWVLKKNSLHKTNLARLGTNMETAHLEKLRAFVKAHRIDSGKLESKERLALQWVESKGGKMPSALQNRRRASGFQDLSTHKAFFETPVRIERPVSRFVPHFPQNRKFVYEVKPRREPSGGRLLEFRERHLEPQVISSFSQESMPLESLFVPYTGPIPAEDTVKLMSNLWDLRKHKQKPNQAIRNGAEPESWNFKISK